MKKMSLITVLLFTKISYSAIGIDDYMSQVKAKNPLFKAYDLSIEAAESKTDSADIELSPMLTAGYLKSKDKSLPNSLALGERTVDQYSLGLAKKFFTGTSLRLDAQTNDFQNESPLIANYDQFSTGSVGLTISQSLWKDFFGAGTRSKIDRQKATAKIETTAAELQRRIFQIQMESDFWDYVVSAEDLKLKKSNLERAQKMETWTSKRVSNGINDRSDLMNVKALATLRSLQLETAQEEFKSQRIKFRENLGLSEMESVPEIKSDLSQDRSYVNDLLNKKNVVSLDSEIAKYESVAKIHVADEVTDQLRPDLSVFGSYATTAYNRDHSEVISKMTSDQYPKTAIGVNFSWVIETDAKSGLRHSAEKESLAAKLKSEKKIAMGQSAWQDLIRKYILTQKNIKSLEQIAQFQRERSKSEQDKFLKGRSITVNVVNAETDAAESELNLLKAKAGLKKLEVSALLFKTLE